MIYDNLDNLKDKFNKDKFNKDKIYLYFYNNLIKINNLHIHSKALEKFLSDNPEETKTISKKY
jgi:hypothetical protein